MKTLLQTLSYAGLLLLVIPSGLVVAGQLSIQDNHLYLLLGTLLWFGTAPFWQGKRKGPTESEG